MKLFTDKRIDDSQNHWVAVYYKKDPGQWYVDLDGEESVAFSGSSADEHHHRLKLGQGLGPIQGQLNNMECV